MITAGSGTSPKVWSAVTVRGPSVAMGSSRSATTTGRYWVVEPPQAGEDLQRADQVEQREPWVEDECDRVVLLGCHVHAPWVCVAV
jgi:hypothetical protein